MLIIHKKTAKKLDLGGQFGYNYLYKMRQCEGAEYICEIMERGCSFCQTKGSRALAKGSTTL